MRLLQIFISILVLGFGSSVALADSSRIASQDSIVEAPTPSLLGHEDRSLTQDEKLAGMQSKIQALEIKVNELLHRSSGQKQALNVVATPYQAKTVQAMLGWSSQEHLLESQANHQKAEVLEEKIQKLQDRIDRFSQKPYLDTKGFKRAGLKVLKGNLVQELQEATTKTAWHKEQAKKIMMTESNKQHHS